MSVEIQLQGLSQRQMVIADMIWACGTKDQVDALIRSLPSKALKAEAQSIVQMMIMAAVEQCYDGLGSMDEATALINRVNK